MHSYSNYHLVAYVENLLNLTWHDDPPSYPLGSSDIKLNDMVIMNTSFERCNTPYQMFRGVGMYCNFQICTL